MSDHPDALRLAKGLRNGTLLLSELDEAAEVLEMLHEAREQDRRAMQEALEALRNGGSVCNSVSTGHDRRIRRDGCTLYAQTEEWCKWAEDEVGPEILAAITHLRQRLEQP